jgi:flagellin
MRINHNIAALNTYRQLSGNVGNTGKSLEKLSSGLRINKAGDDAAGLAISEKMRAQIRGLDQASRNASDAISLIQTAEGALTETHSILQRMRELAVQSATDTNTTDDRAEIQKEIDGLVDEIDRIATKTQFNKQNLLDGTYGIGVGNDKFFHIGANSSQILKVEIGDMQANALGGVDNGGNKYISNLKTGGGSVLDTRTAADFAIQVIDKAITDVSSERAKLGGIQNRLDHTINNLGATSENLAASESRIRDVDMAKEMMEFTKNNILSQASQAMLAQANMQPQSVLQLLQ